MSKYLLIFCLLGCQPMKVNHEVKGNAATTNVIKIEVDIPPELLLAFQNTCTNSCEGDIKCVSSCNAKQLSNYTNTILSLISMFNHSVLPTPTPQPSTTF